MKPVSAGGRDERFPAGARLATATNPFGLASLTWMQATECKRRSNTIIFAALSK